MKINQLNNYSNYIKRTFSKTNYLQKTVPFVSAPLVAYYIGESQDKNVSDIVNFLQRKCLEVPQNLNPHSLTQTGWDPASQSKVKGILDKYYKEGKIDQQEYEKYKHKINFTGSSDAYEAQGDDLGQYGTTDISDGGSYADIEPDIPVMGESAGIGIEGDEVFGQLETMTDMLDNPLLEGVAAELLPGTKFLKPIKDLTDGDVSGAAVRTGTRAGEMIVAPVKLGWAA